LSPAHRELIKLLARIAVTDYLHESDAADIEAPADQHKESSR
jgi:hypothetical protein